MLLRGKILGKILAMLLVALLVANPVVVPVAWAEEIEEPPVEEPAIQVEAGEGEPSGGEEGAESVDGGDATITTGDAESLAEVETTANTNLDCVPGEVSVPEDPCAPPEVETDCPDGVEISHDNEAEVVDEAESLAITGDNKIVGASGNALIDTGEATAGASLENKVNTNVVVFEEGEEEDVDGESDSGDIKIGNENEGTLTNDVDVLADTGENLANENGGDATIKTGDALAYANILNLLNTNIVGSDFELYFLNLLSGEKRDVDLNQIWGEIIASGEAGGFQLNGGGDNLHLFMIQNSNLAVLENEVNVTAESGANQANENQGKGKIQTGDATALANVINFVNLNLVGSKFFLGVVNIFGDFDGNLILPRPEKFVGDLTSGEEPGVKNESPSSEVVFSNQNEAELDDSVRTVAETGSNQTNNNQGDSLIETGDAQSQANSFSLINTNIQRNNWFFLIINNLGSKLFQILGWSSPDAVEDAPESGPVIFQIGEGASQGGGETGGQVLGQEVENKDGLPGSVVQNQNTAQVTNDIQVQAGTGQNQANENNGGAEIKTGKATALANLFNFINLNILGSRWFLGLVNIFGDWSGNAIFAHPDMIVGLTNGLGQAMVGETVGYTLSYQNQGHDEANEVKVEFELPQGTSFVSDSSGLTPEISGQKYSWSLGTVGSGEGGSFTISVKVNSDFYFEEQLVFRSRIIRQAYAAENEKTSEVVATASVGTPDPESNLDNNTASVKMLVYQSISFGQESEEQEIDQGQGQPELEVSAWNNVGEFVYPGDIVTFEIAVKNTGGVFAHDIYLTQELYNGVPEEGFGAAVFEIGTLEPGKGVKLSFGLKLADNGILPAGPYHTEAQATGLAPNGEGVDSNVARTEFEIRLKEISSLFEAKALGKEEEVLGAYQENECPDDKDILPYVLLFLLSSLGLVERSKRLAKVKQVYDKN